MVWPGPIDEYLLKRQKEDGLSEKEIFAELSGTNVAEWVRIVLGVDDLHAAYEADQARVRSLLTDVFMMGDLDEKLRDDDMEWRKFTQKSAAELDYDGKPILEVARDRCGVTLKYPCLPCVIVEDMYGKRENFLPIECFKMYHTLVTGPFYRMYRPL